MSNPDTTRIFNYPEVTTPASDAKILLDSQTVGSKCIDANLFRCDLIDKTITQRGTFEASEDDADGFKKVVVDIPYTDVHVASGPIATFEGEDLPLKSLTASIVPVQAGSGDPSPTNVRPISGWTEEVITVADDLQNPTVTHTTTIPFTDRQGQSVEVFGGSVEVVSGALSEQFVCEKLPFSNYLTKTDLTNVTRYTYALSNEIDATDYSTQKCNMATVDASYTSDTPHFYCGNMNLGARAYLFLPIGVESSVDVEFYYKLATPTTFYTQPTSIKSLDGENNVSASTGDVDVEYQTVWVRPTE